MPYSTRKVRNRNCYKVSNRNTKRVFAKCTSKINAKRQMRLLRAIKNNKTFKLRVSGRNKKTTP